MRLNEKNAAQKLEKNTRGTHQGVSPSMFGSSSDFSEFITYSRLLPLPESFSSLGRVAGHPWLRLAFCKPKPLYFFLVVVAFYLAYEYERGGRGQRGNCP